MKNMMILLFALLPLTSFSTEVNLKPFLGDFVLQKETDYDRDKSEYFGNICAPEVHAVTTWVGLPGLFYEYDRTAEVSFWEIDQGKRCSKEHPLGDQMCSQTDLINGKKIEYRVCINAGFWKCLLPSSASESLEIIGDTLTYKSRAVEDTVVTRSVDCIYKRKVLE